MIDIQIDEPFQDLVDPAAIEQAVQAALDHQSAREQTELSIVFSDNDHIQSLNRDYLGIDAPTDVLSFPSDEINPETGSAYLGDVIISVPRAQEQAQAGRHPLSAEIQLLVIHGVLHLLGHDHAEPEEKERMWSAQAEVLSVLGSPIRGPKDASGSDSLSEPSTP